MKSIKYIMVVAMGLLLACGGGKSGNGLPEGWTVDTQVDHGSVKAGSTVKVTCILMDKKGNQVQTKDQFIIVVMPPKGVDQPEISDSKFTPTKTGEYKIACGIDDRQDDSPAIVKVVPSGPVKTVATVKPQKVKAGEEATVTCGAYDKYDNPVTDAALIVDPVEGLDIEGMSVSSKNVGKYKITCSIKDVKVKEKDESILEVTANIPAKVELTVKPKKAVYHIGNKITLSYKVFDKFDNEVDWDAEFVPPKKDVTQISANRWTLDKEGIFEFKVVLKDPYSNIQDSRTLICDENPPKIEITYPPRGLEVMGDADLIVKGKVTDDGAGVDWVKVNGDKVELNDKGEFEYTIHSVHGLNPVLVTAADKAGHDAKVTRGYYYSLDYLPVKDDSDIDSLVIDQGIMARMNQQVLDDGDHDHKHINDIATIVEVLLGDVDYSQLLGQIPAVSKTFPNVINYQVPGLNLVGVKVGVWGDLTLTGKITDLEFGKPYVGLTLEDGGIKSDLKIQPVKMTLEISARLDVTAGIKGKWEVTLQPGPTGTGTTTGEIGTLIVNTDVLISKQPQDKDFKVKVKNFHVETKDIDIQPLTSFVIDLGTINVPKNIAKWIHMNKIQLGQIDLTKQVSNFSQLLSKNIIDPLVNSITQPLEKLLEPVVEKALTLALGKFLGMMKLDKDLDLPVGQFGHIKLHIKTDISTIDFTKEAGVIGLNAGTLSKKGVDKDENIIGTILRTGCSDRESQQFAFHQQPSMQFAGHYDFINEMIFMVWWSGLLNNKLDLGSQMGGGSGGAMPMNIKDLQITPTFYLPPILDDCNKDGRQELQVGDLYLDVKFKMGGTDQHLGIWVQAKADAQIVGKGTKAGLKINKLSYLELEIHDIGGNMGSLLKMIDTFLPMLKSQVEGKEFDFTIPPIDLGQAIPGIPQGTMLQLGNLGSYHEAGYAVIGGDLL